MARLENLKNPAQLRAHLEDMNEAELLGQQLSQQGAIHVVEFMLVHGCSNELAVQLLASLRANMETVVQVAQAKGFNRLLGENATGFH